MRRIFLSVAATAALVSLQPGEAQAFGDTCKTPLVAGSGRQGDIYAARAAAISAWQKAATKRDGAAFGDWYYSADRAVNCTWPEPAAFVQCVATATPCGRGR